MAIQKMVVTENHAYCSACGDVGIYQVCRHRCLIYLAYGASDTEKIEV
jgi:hypothetical protein